MALRRRPSSTTSPAPAPALPPDNDDLLLDILLRLPPLPSSLLRASLVCKRWRSLVSDAGFLRRFRAFHGRPPLLGVFGVRSGCIVHGDFSFTPLLDPPDRIPAARFSLPLRPGERCGFGGCRHGLVLLFIQSRREAVIWNPVTGYLRHVPYPPGFGKVRVGAVLLAAADYGASSLFKLVLVEMNGFIASARLYQSEFGIWGDSISIAMAGIYMTVPSVLVGNALYWLLYDDNILEFDLDRQTLAVIDNPVGADIPRKCSFQIMRAEGNGLGLVFLVELSMQLWERKANSYGVVQWVLQKTIELDKLLLLQPSMGKVAKIVGFAEDANVMLLWTHAGALTIQLESMQSKNLSKNITDCPYYPYHPYTSFFTTAKNFSSFCMEGKIVVEMMERKCGTAYELIIL